MDIGKRLSELRLQNHISQEELADVLNVSRQTISRWESSLTSPHMDMILKICEYYHMSASDFFKEAQPKKPSYIPYTMLAVFMGLLLISLFLPENKSNHTGSLIYITPSMILLWFGVIGTVFSVILISITHRK